MKTQKLYNQMMASMLKSSEKKEKGVAGLNIFLSLIAMIFVIGILVMAFALTGSQLKNVTTDNLSNGIITNTTGALASVPTYFPLFITLGAVVVIILLLVIVIVAMRGSGLIGGEGGTA